MVGSLGRNWEGVTPGVRHRCTALELVTQHTHLELEASGEEDQRHVPCTALQWSLGVPKQCQQKCAPPISSPGAEQAGQTTPTQKADLSCLHWRRNGHGNPRHLSGSSRARPLSSQFNEAPFSSEELPGTATGLCCCWVHFQPSQSTANGSHQFLRACSYTPTGMLMAWMLPLQKTTIGKGT